MSLAESDQQSITLLMDSQFGSAWAGHVNHLWLSRYLVQRGAIEGVDDVGGIGAGVHDQASLKLGECIARIQDVKQSSLSSRRRRIADDVEASRVRGHQFCQPNRVAV